MKVSPYLNLLIGTIAPSKSSSASRQIILSEDLFNHLAVNVREAILAALEAVGEGFMVDAELVKDSCLDIMNVDWVFYYVESEVVRNPVNVPFLDSSSSHPHRKGLPMVIASVGIRLGIALSVDRSSEFTSPNNQGIVKQSSLFQVHNKRRARLVRVTGGDRKPFFYTSMMIPPAVVELNESNPSFSEAPRHDAIGREGARRFGVVAVKLIRRFRLVTQVGEMGNTSLHSVGHFVLGDTGFDFRVAYSLMVRMVEAPQVVEECSSSLGVHAGGIAQVKDGVVSTPKLDPLVLAWQESGPPQTRKESLAGRSLASYRIHDNEGWEVVVCRSESIVDPRAHTRTTR